MIGAGILRLAGVALELTGPAAIFSYLGAGIVKIGGLFPQETIVLVADRSPSSVLMVHRYMPPHWSVGVADRLKRFREGLGATTSPEEDGTPS